MSAAYPKEANAGLVDLETVQRYLNALFGYVDFEPHQAISLRPIGEKGTPKYGAPVEVDYCQPAIDDAGAWVAQSLLRFARHDLAGFIIPAVLGGGGGGAADIELFTSILVDIDTGDADAKQAYVEGALGPASIVVWSGGTTFETGQRKRHLYWLLTEPTGEIERVAGLRLMLAEKIGADVSIGRAHQPIRIPGSVYCKDGMARTVRAEFRQAEYDLGDIADGIEALAQMPGVKPPERPAQRKLSEIAMAGIQRPEGGINVSGGATAGVTGLPLAQALTETVHEGSDTAHNRWSTFTQVAGHYIHCARRGEMSIEEARELTIGWMNGRMAPPWPEERADREFRAILNVDVQARGPIVAPAPGAAQPGTAIDMQAMFDRHEVGAFTMTTPPARRFLVNGLIAPREPALLAADGGVGKTFLMLDLAIKVAKREPGEALAWMGEDLTEECGGTVVVITGEDTRDEMHRRIWSIDPENRRSRRAGAVYILPMIDLGGAFPFVQMGASRQPVVNPRWAALRDHILTLPDLKLVIVDPMAQFMHDDENKADIVNAFYQSIIPHVCGAPESGGRGAALLVAHHVRKEGVKPIDTVEDMRAAIRGSSAIVGNMRQAIGVWPAGAYKKLMTNLGLRPAPRRLFKAAVVKANNPDAFQDVKYLLREESGLLTDVTGRAHAIYASGEEERRAWLVFAIRRAALQGFPFTYRAGGRGLYDRRHDLPPALADLSKHALETLAKDCMDRHLIERHVKRGYFDVPGGTYVLSQAPEPEAGAWPRERQPDWDAHEFDPERSSIRPTP